MLDAVMTDTETVPLSGLAPLAFFNCDVIGLKSVWTAQANGFRDGLSLERFASMKRLIDRANLFMTRIDLAFKMLKLSRCSRVSVASSLVTAGK